MKSKFFARYDYDDINYIVGSCKSDAENKQNSDIKANKEAIDRNNQNDSNQESEIQANKEAIDRNNQNDSNQESEIQANKEAIENINAIDQRQEESITTINNTIRDSIYNINVEDTTLKIIKK